MSATARIEHGWRPGALGHIVALHGRYYAAAWQFGPQFEVEVATELADFARGFDPARDAIWLALDQDDIVGSVAVNGSGSEAPAARLRWLILAPEARGTGIGRALLGHALAFCRARGVPRIVLWTFAGLDSARRLYDDAGFVLTEARADSVWGPAIVHQRYELALA